MRRRFLRLAAANIAAYTGPYTGPPPSANNRLLVTHNRLTLRNGTDRLLYRNGDLLQLHTMRLQLRNAVDFLLLRN